MRRTLTLALLLSLAATSCAWIARASIDSNGIEADGNSGNPSLSADGRYVAFTSMATNLVPGDANGESDVFVRDFASGITTRISVGSAGTEADGASYDPAISADGTRIAFESDATNLVPDDTNGVRDVFVHDTTTQTTSRLSVSSTGVQGNFASESPTISADGRVVAFETASTWGGFPFRSDVYVHDTDTGITTRASVNSMGAAAEGWSTEPAISADGTHVAFVSTATNLTEDDTNNHDDVFVHDTSSGLTTRVSVDSTGTWVLAPATSADGRFTTYWAAVESDPAPDFQLLLYDAATDATVRVDVDDQGNPPPVNFTSLDSGGPTISNDGRFVAFVSFVALVPDDTNSAPDVYVRDTVAGATTRVSVDSMGAWTGHYTDGSAVSPDGRYAAFTALDITNGVSDVIVRAVHTPSINTVTPDTLAAGTTTNVAITGTGFGPDTTVATFVTNPNGVTVDTLTVVSPTELQLTVTVDPTAAPGPRNLYLQIPGPGPGDGGMPASLDHCSDCLTITP